MKEYSLIKNYLISLALILCAFLLAFGIGKAQQNTSHALTGDEPKTVNQSDIVKFFK